MTCQARCRLVDPQSSHSRARSRFGSRVAAAADFVVPLHPGGRHDEQRQRSRTPASRKRTAVSRRSRRQLPAPEGAARRARAAQARARSTRVGAARGRGRGDPRHRPVPGGPGAARASPTANSAAPTSTSTSWSSSTASRPRAASRSASTAPTGNVDFAPPVMHVTGEGPARQADPARRLRVPEVGHRAHAEGDDPVADDAALPRRPRRDQPRGLSGPGGVLRRRRAGYRDEIARPGGRGLHVPAARRHQPRLPVRREDARRRAPARRRPERAAAPLRAS